MKRENTKRLTDEDIERIIDKLWKDDRFQKDYDQRWKWLSDLLQLRITKSIGWAAEDQAKFWAISEILKANYREKSKKVEGEE